MYFVHFFSRNREGEIRYKQDTFNTKLEWDSIDSYCKHVFLQCPYKVKTINDKNGTKDRYVKYVRQEDIRKLLTLWFSLLSADASFE